MRCDDCRGEAAGGYRSRLRNAGGGGAEAPDYAYQAQLPSSDDDEDMVRVCQTCAASIASRLSRRQGLHSCSISKLPSQQRTAIPVQRIRPLSLSQTPQEGEGQAAAGPNAASSDSGASPPPDESQQQLSDSEDEDGCAFCA